MVKIVVAGAAGRMGRRLIAAVRETSNAVLAGAVECAGHPHLGKDAGLLDGGGALDVPLVDSLDAAFADGAVLIDFSAVDATMTHLAFCRARKVPVVIGTTGLNAEQKKELQDASREIPVVFAPNMSVGVNVCLRMLKELARVLGPDFEVEILEMHHNKKKDAPSGTALRMGEVVAEALGRDWSSSAVYSRHGQTGERTRDEIGIQALRGGDIVGEHTVYFIGMGERIELTHRAMTRDMFARGAVRAALWLAGQAPGLYDMQDVLGIK